ncbi:MAG: M14 family zinc carboxypeptidase [Bacteroidota bacterium]
MKRYFVPVLLAIIMLIFSAPLSAQVEKYSRVKVYTDGYGIHRLSELGICVDHGETKHGYWYMSDFSASEIQLMQQHGFSYEVIIDDVSVYYVQQNDPNSSRYVPPRPQSIGCSVSPVYPTPANFNLGSMGGFFTYQEILNHLDNMYNLYPNLIKQKAAIGTNTIEGRPVYWLKISDNPNTDENEPEVLYSGVHHAREPASVAQLIMYMYYLLENYATNAEVQYLVNNSEMYFVPVVNPDGYIYNETTNPNGGGMWRKNRRNSGNGDFGVDLNRNYGFNWGYDNQGSSPNTGSGTYRGTGPFSEPETQNMRNFCNAHQFRLCLNYHTYGNLMIYPWGINNPPYTYTPDSAQFTQYGAHLTTHNHYIYGTAIQTVLYTVNGTSDDWMYGEQNTKPKIMAMTPEAGRSDEGFWPPMNRIVDICKENIWQNLHACHLVLKYARATDEEPNYLPSLSGFFNYKIKRLGMDAPATYTVSIIPISPEITSVGPPKTYSSLALLQEANDSISFTLSSSTPNGQIIRYVLSVNNGLYTENDTIVKRYGQSVIAFASNCNSMTGWASPTGWGSTTANFYSAPASITDSPGGDYGNNDNNYVTTSASINLTNALSAQLTFYATWAVETNFDYAQVLASDDNGNTWTPLCGKYTKPGNAYQDFGNPVYDGYQFAWLKEEMPLDNFIGQNILIRFVVVSDGGGTADGFYFDDVKVEKIIPSTIGMSEYVTGITIEQNMPNPASDYTYINYSLPASAADAVLYVYNSFGQVVMNLPLDVKGYSLLLNTQALAQGVYYVQVRSGEVSSASLKMTVIR